MQADKQHFTERQNFKFRHCKSRNMVQRSLFQHTEKGMEPWHYEGDLQTWWEPTLHVTQATLVSVLKHLKN